MKMARQVPSKGDCWTLSIESSKGLGMAGGRLAGSGQTGCRLMNTRLIDCSAGWLSAG